MLFAEDDDLEEIATLLGYSPDALASELLNLARARASLLIRAADFASEMQVVGYLAYLLGRDPTVEEVSLSRRAERRLRLTEDQRIALEGAQFDRCRLCGRFLDRAASPHVDHIQPLAQGGEDDLGNLQLLCGKCNLGKHDLTSWLVGVPYQTDDRSNVRLRYVVLARAAGKCSEAGCDTTSRHEELELISRVPLSKGGRWIFDNLRVVCSSHARSLNRERRRVTRRALTGTRKQPTKISS